MSRSGVAPRPDEVAAALPGDELVAADVVMDRAFSLAAAPEQVWPWLLQLGKRRAGWYFPRSVERLVPPSRRGLRRLDPTLTHLEAGETVPDWGGRDATLTVVRVEEGRTLLYSSERGRLAMTWCLTLRLEDAGTRVQSRVRLGPVKRAWLARSVGGLFDELTIAGLAKGLAERLG